MAADRGFTLVETLVVLVLAALALAAAPALTGGLSGIRLRSAADEMAGRLRDARGRALLAGAPVAVWIDPDGRRWRADADAEPQPMPGVVGRVGIEPASLIGPDRLVRVGFHPDGGATAVRVTLFHGDRAETIRVDRLTGRVSRDD